jgi:membrane protein DedA with SNARE-associated domain
MNLEQQLLDFIRRIFESIGWPGVILLMAIESACIPLPSEIIMPLAGWMLIGPGRWELIFLAGFFGAIGNLIGSALSYWFGASGGRLFLHRFGKYLLITDHELENADRWFARYGDRAAFFSRLLPGVRTFISLPAGIARTPWTRFFVYTFAGSLIWSTALAYGGYLLGSNWEKIRSVMRPFDIPIIIIAVVLIATFIWKRIRTIRAQNNTSEHQQ